MTNDTAAHRHLAESLSTVCRYAIAATPTAACRLSRLFLYSVVVVLGDVNAAQRDQVLAGVHASDDVPAPIIEILDVVDPRVAVNAVARALRFVG